jgi:hypothetical protein
LDTAAEGTFSPFAASVAGPWVLPPGFSGPSDVHYMFFRNAVNPATGRTLRSVSWPQRRSLRGRKRRMLIDALSRHDRSFAAARCAGPDRVNRRSAKCLAPARTDRIEPQSAAESPSRRVRAGGKNTRECGACAGMDRRKTWPYIEAESGRARVHAPGSASQAAVRPVRPAAALGDGEMVSYKTSA